jgi:uncharacterized protein (TIGR02246 family)
VYRRILQWSGSGLLAALIAISPLANASDGDPLLQVRSTWEQAMLAGDARAAASVFAEAAVQMRPGRATNRGRASIEAGYADDFKGAAVTAVRMKPVQTDVAGDRAFEHGTFTITWLARNADATPLELQGRYLLWVRRSEAGDWRIEVEMHTVEPELPEAQLSRLR